MLDQAVRFAPSTSYLLHLSREGARNWEEYTEEQTESSICWRQQKGSKGGVVGSVQCSWGDSEACLSPRELGWTRVWIIVKSGIRHRLKITSHGGRNWKKRTGVHRADSEWYNRIHSRSPHCWSIRKVGRRDKRDDRERVSRDPTLGRVHDVNLGG